jgi:hypothetical protein
MGYSPYMKDVNLAIALKGPAGWEMTWPWEDVVVSHGNDSRFRGLPTVTAMGTIPCSGYDAAILPKCKGKNAVNGFDLFDIRD